jgi:Zn-dependent protease with chaperone function
MLSGLFDAVGGYFYWVLAIMAFGWMSITMLFMYFQTQIGGVRVTPSQFPKSYALFEELVQQMGFKKTPEFYIMNGHGAYNAFASCVPGYRNYTVMHSEILHAFELGGDEDAFRTVMAHELGHMKLGHVKLFRAVVLSLFGLIPGLNILANAIGRSQEYEADRMALYFVDGQKASKSFLMLLTSAFLYRKVDVQQYRETTSRYMKIGQWTSNLFASHPIAPWRIDAFCTHCQGGLFTHKMQPQVGTPDALVKDRFSQYREQ